MSSKRNNKSSQYDRSFCHLDYTSIFIGFTSLPIGKEEQFKKELSKLFENYLKDYKKNFPSKIPKEEFSTLYIPKFYVIFSPFDLVSLSVMDSFEFGSQTFCPFHPDWSEGEESSRRSFSYQVILGPTPKFSEDREKKESQSIRLAKSTFLSERPLPLIAICQLKLNNALIIGAGVDFVRCVIKAIRRHFDYLVKENKFKKDEIQLIILESYSWHELTLLLFSTSYNKMLQFILSIREMTVSKMKKIIEKEAVEELKKTDDIWDWKQFDEAPKLGLELISKSNKLQYNININASHIFLNSITNLGFRFEIFEEGVDTTRVKPIHKENIYAFCRFSTKTGHLASGIKTTIGIPYDKITGQALFSVGKGGDFVYPFEQKVTDGNKESGMTLVPIKEFINSIITTCKKPCIENHITAMQTILISESCSSLLPNEELPYVNKSHHFIETQIKDLGIDFSEIKDKLYASLRHCISKVASKRILNAVALFNEGIQDRFLFSNFVELKPYVHWLISTVQNLVKKGGSLAVLADCINKATDGFEKAWRNRFHAGWRMSEITDFNLEYKGGIQQLLSAFDGAYKAVSSVIGAPDPIALVAGSPRIFSTERTIQLNFFDIFQPEFFAARVSHEAAVHRLSTFCPEKFSNLSCFISQTMNAQYNVN